jgi:hypothetical protein
MKTFYVIFHERRRLVQSRDAVVDDEEWYRVGTPSWTTKIGTE